MQLWPFKQVASARGYTALFNVQRHKGRLSHLDALTSKPLASCICSMNLLSHYMGLIECLT